MTIHEQIKECEAAIETSKNKLNDLRKEAIYCGKCGHYYEASREKTEFGTMEGTGRTSSWCEFDPDEVYDCTYLITYRVCPLCGELSEIKRTETNIRNKHYAGQTLKWSW